MKKSIVIPILVIGTGIGWLLNTLNLLATVDWVWSILLGLAGILCFILWGMNKLTCVVGPFLLISSIFSLLRQTDLLKVEYEIPYLVIILGILLLVVEFSKLPPPEWLEEKEKGK